MTFKRRVKKKKQVNISLHRKIFLIYAKTIFVIKVLIIFSIGIFFFTDYMSSLKQNITESFYEYTGNIGFKLENVLIAGQINLKKQDILLLLNVDKGTPIFSLNLNSIYSNLKSNSWIKNISIIERRLPNTLYIKLIERIPIAIWQVNKKIFLIDNEGYKITDDIKNFSHLIHIVGYDANLYASQLINDLSRYPDLLKTVISAVRYGERRWDLNLWQNINVKMPETSFLDALRYLSNLHKKNLLFYQNYKVIDLRDNNKFYIEKY